MTKKPPNMVLRHWLGVNNVQLLLVHDLYLSLSQILRIPRILTDGQTTCTFWHLTLTQLNTFSKFFGISSNILPKKISLSRFMRQICHCQPAKTDSITLSNVTSTGKKPTFQFLLFSDLSVTEMCWMAGTFQWQCSQLSLPIQSPFNHPVSYTHLTLPTICSV